MQISLPFAIWGRTGFRGCLGQALPWTSCHSPWYHLFHRNLSLPGRCFLVLYLIQNSIDIMVLIEIIYPIWGILMQIAHNQIELVAIQLSAITKVLKAVNWACSTVNIFSNDAPSFEQYQHSFQEINNWLNRMVEMYKVHPAIEVCIWPDSDVC